MSLSERARAYYRNWQNTRAVIKAMNTPSLPSVKPTVAIIRGVSALALATAGGATLAACTQENPQVINQQFTENLERLMGIDSSSSIRDQLINLEIAHTIDNWRTNTNLGHYYSEKGQRIDVSLNDKGFLKFPENLRKNRFLYPGQLSTEPMVSKEVYSDGRNHVYVYGTTEFVNEYGTEEEKELLGRFMQDYFRDSRSEHNVIHINAVPPNTPFKIVQVGSAKDPFSPPKEANAATNTIPANPPRRDMYGRTDVVFNLQNLHNNADSLGMSLEKRISMAAVNEGINLNGTARSFTIYAQVDQNQSASSLGALYFLFRPETAESLVSPLHQDFSAMQARYMRGLVQ